MKARFLALAALVLGLASCQQDVELDNPVAVGGEVDFQLKVDAKELATRADDGDDQYGFDSAYGAIDYLCDEADAFRADWTEVDLRYSLEVYDYSKDGYENAVPVKDRLVKVVDSYESVAFDLRLVPGRKYHFVVFADFVPQDATENANIDTQSDLGLHHEIGENLGQITIKNDAINDECTDAYFATKDITISNSAAQDIVLKRPYGKVRVIATDLDQLNLNVEPKSVKVTYTAAHPAAFNAVTGAIDAEYTTAEYTNEYNDIKKTDMSRHIYTGFDNDGYKVTNANGETRNTHMTLFTDYILAARDEQETIHFTMQVFDDVNAESLIKETHFSTDIPVQRNHLTTIIGNVLTTATEINVTIDDNFAAKHERNFVLVNTAKELQEALDAYKNGQTILFDANIEGNVTVDQVAGKDYVIDGNNYEYTGTITIDGNARMNEPETVLIKNVNFTAANDVKIDFIEMNSTDGAVRYAHNVTIENCTFNGGEDAVAARFRQCKNIKFVNCEVISGHSLAQLYGCTNVTIEGTTVKALRGVSFGTSTGCVVKNSAFDVEKYGLRVDADGARTLSVEKSSIKAFLPIVARKASANYTINLGEGNVFEAPGYDVVFTTGDDEATFVAPAEYTITGAENFEVFPGEKMYAYDAAMLQAFINEAVDGDVIEFAKDIEGDVTVAQKPDTSITINGKDFNYAGSIVVDGKSATYTTAGLTIMSLNFVADSISADACIRLGNGENNTRYTCNVTVKGCTFDVPGAVGVKSYTGGDKNLKIANCTATANAHSLLQAKGIDGILVEGCTVNSKNGLNFNNSNNVVVSACQTDVRGYAVRFGEGSAATGAAETYTIENSTLKSTCEEAGDAVIVLRGTADKATLYLVNTTIDGNPQIINNAADATVKVNGDSVVTSADALRAALANGGTITLGTNVEGTFLIRNKNVELKGVNGATITGRVNISGQTDGNTVTFNNVAFNRNDTDSAAAWNTAYGSSNCLTYKAVVMIYGNSLTQVQFNGCKFYKNNGAHKGAITNTTCELIVDNCYFEGTSSAIYSQCNLSITNSTFNYTGTNNVIASINGCGDAGGKFIFKNNRSTGNKIFALSQFLSTTSFGNGTYYFDVDDNAEFDYYFLNTGRVTNKTFAEGSLTF